MLEQLEKGYAWPGGYPLFGLMADGGCICAQCARDESDLIQVAESDPQWELVAVDVNWEDDSLYCDHCSGKVESAYGGES